MKDKEFNEEIAEKSARWSIIVFIVLLMLLFLPALFIRLMGT